MLLKTRWREEGQFKKIVNQRTERLDNISISYFPLLLKYEQLKCEILGSYLQQ